MPTYHYVQFFMGQLNYFDSFPLHCNFFQAFDSDVKTKIHDSLNPASVRKQRKSYQWSTVKLDSQIKNYFHIRVVSQFATKQHRLITSPFEILLK